MEYSTRNQGQNPQPRNDTPFMNADRLAEMSRIKILANLFCSMQVRLFMKSRGHSLPGLSHVVSFTYRVIDAANVPRGGFLGAPSVLRPYAAAA